MEAMASSQNQKTKTQLEAQRLKAGIEAVFQQGMEQGEVIIGLYKMVFPDWDQIEKIKGYPRVGEELWKFICASFQKFDKSHHPGCFPGGAWLNWGFAMDRELKPWEISLKDCQPVYQLK